MASIYVGKLSRRISERDLEDSFGRYGRIERINLKHGYAFVDFEDRRDAEDAVRGLDGTSLDGDKIIVEFSHGGRGRGRGPPRGRATPRGSFGGDYRVYIENLPRDISWQDLKDHFRPIGEVLFGDVWVARNGKFKGVIEFKHKTDMKQAVKKMDDTELRGKTIRVYEDDKSSRRSRSRSRSPRSRTPRSPSRSRSRSPVSKKRSRSRTPNDRSPRSNYKESNHRNSSPNAKYTSRDE
eukprot:TRINITY_DN282_c0_g1_i3.p1 TRINITY_DN282_c0_g1~~TRINITY_DN282_c0_g1_i3.p1  ORF type:complete len:238 (-),score=39.57 TRINITY_DN282_c0_g1_i3:137-850(-)